jgi:hypothetical protein
VGLLNDLFHRLNDGYFAITHRFCQQHFKDFFI